MPLAYEDIESTTLTLLSKYSGKKIVQADQMVNKDLGIEGWDSIAILEELEELYKLDLHPLIDSVTTYLPPTWWDKLWGKARGAPIADLTVRELIDYVARHAGEGQNETVPRFF